MIRRILALLACAVALAACQLDVDVDVLVEPDGTGMITVTASVDADIVEQIPTLADEIAIDDVISAGWIVDGPNARPDGGLQMVMTHDFAGDGEATNLLRSLGPPFNGMRLGRGTVNDVTTNQLEGRLVLVDGFDTFADADLVAAVGSLPFSDEIAASGATPETSLSFTIRAVLPGVIDEDLTNVDPNADGVLEWVVPVDGTVVQWQAETTQQPGEGKPWARPLSIAALVALIAWVAVMTLFIGYVTLARWRRARSYRRRNFSG